MGNTCEFIPIAALGTQADYSGSHLVIARKPVFTLRRVCQFVTDYEQWELLFV
jgi:hypothetical protein